MFCPIYVYECTVILVWKLLGRMKKTWNLILFDIIHFLRCLKSTMDTQFSDTCSSRKYTDTHTHTHHMHRETVIFLMKTTMLSKFNHRKRITKENLNHEAQEAENLSLSLTS